VGLPWGVGLFLMQDALFMPSTGILLCFCAVPAHLVARRLCHVSNRVTQNIRATAKRAPLELTKTTPLCGPSAPCPADKAAQTPFTNTLRVLRVCTLWGLAHIGYGKQWLAEGGRIRASMPDCCLW
jgi:hypothetical protein